MDGEQKCGKWLFSGPGAGCRDGRHPLETTSANALGRASLGSHDETLAWPLAVLATSLHHLGRRNEAIACWQEAAAIYTDRGLDADAAAMHHHIRTADHPLTGPHPADGTADRSLIR
ncbi:hypothetical protein GT204_17490 [Streptomyces sp. SID4919]|uniref:hypothetical protein n=1 Tax=unclassified Streptomyces TaxID=2593676 RepID=UPI0008238639|nr:MULTISPECIES: hypothetical protein [unclassified Streptomyces]MYY10655.1 hypothetical protein [Streptomyces sp. SID4919]SCK62894.1 hypothetical protein YW7DRAFT_06874 [Streptomyces sp. AmelKG-E11A]